VYAHVISDQLTEAADIFARAVVATTYSKVPLLVRVLAKEPILEAEKGSDLGALGETRTPNLLIRRDLRMRPLPAQSDADLLKYSSLMRSKRRC
jgi:hypothetical protein